MSKHLHCLTYQHALTTYLTPHLLCLEMKDLYLCIFVYLAGGVEQGNCSFATLKLRMVFPKIQFY